MADDQRVDVEARRKSLNERRAELQSQKDNIDGEIATIDRELSAWKAFEDALQGESPSPAPAPKQPRQPRAPASEGGRKRRTGFREELLSRIKQHGDGVTVSQLIEELLTPGEDKTSLRTAIYNGLRNLKDQVRKEGDRYLAA